MRKLLLALMFWAATAPAWAQKVDRVEIVEFGVYTADKLKSERDANGQLHSIIGNLHLEEATTTVQAEHGVKFGIRFRVIGEPDGQAVTLKKVMIFPPPGLRAPTAPEPLMRSEDTAITTIGETGYLGFEFDDPWELVPGVWTIQLRQGDRMLAEQRFTVVASRSI